MGTIASKDAFSAYYGEVLRTETESNSEPPLEGNDPNVPTVPIAPPLNRDDKAPAGPEVTNNEDDIDVPNDPAIRAEK